ncbi:MAG: biotin/lipoyl-binding protein [Faecousia sp.]
MSKKLNKRKKLLLSAVSLVTVCAVGVGIWFGVSRSKADPVLVYPFRFLGMTEYWGDSRETYGPVTTDKIQTVFLSDTQTVTEVLVKEGDTVKKGDVLLRFDTTLSDLALERKRLDVEKVKLQLEEAKDRLQQIKGMRPMVIPTVKPDTGEDDESLGSALAGDYQISTMTEYDGSSEDKALILWLRTNASVEDGMLEDLRRHAEEYQNANLPVPDPESGESEEEPGEGESGGGSGEGESDGESGEGESGEGESGGESGGGTPEHINVNRFYVVVKVTQGNRALGQKVTWQGLIVKKQSSGSFAFQFFSPGSVPDHMLAEEEGNEKDGPDIDYGSGYTAAQLAEMRRDQEKKIKELELSQRMAEAEYKIMQLEVSDGAVRASIDGTVISLLSEDEAKKTQQPVLKVSGGGGFYVQGVVSELEKDSLVIGQEVTINDWNTGMMYTGTIHSVGDLPSSRNGYNGMNNPNASYYPLIVFVDGSADLQEGRYVSVQYASGTSENGIYLENPYLRTEQGKTYVMVRGENGRLEQRFVTTGKSLWGSYTEVLSGLTQEDLIAFPYGKTVKPGAPTQEGDLGDLYG